MIVERINKKYGLDIQLSKQFGNVWAKGLSGLSDDKQVRAKEDITKFKNTILLELCDNWLMSYVNVIEDGKTVDKRKIEVMKIRDEAEMKVMRFEAFRVLED